MAISYLQRALLAHDLQRLSPNEWEACFLEVGGPTGEGGGMWEGSSVHWWECMVVGCGVCGRVVGMHGRVVGCVGGWYRPMAKDHVSTHRNSCCD